MKYYKLRLLSFCILIATIVFASCKEVKKEETENVAIEVKEEIATEKKKESVETTFKNNKSCTAFFKTLDFSSLCFNAEHTPEDTLQSPENGQLCLYRMLTDGTSELTLHITYVDYHNGGLNGRQTPEKVKQLMQNSFTNRKKNTNRYSSYEDVSIGDEGYIAYDSTNKLKTLHIRIANVETYIEVSETDKNPCMASTQELLKLGNLVLATIKK